MQLREKFSQHAYILYIYKYSHPMQPQKSVKASCLVEQGVDGGMEVCIKMAQQAIKCNKFLTVGVCCQSCEKKVGENWERDRSQTCCSCTPHRTVLLAIDIYLSSFRTNVNYYETLIASLKLHIPYLYIAFFSIS